jgi:uncharacterized membrane protein
MLLIDNFSGHDLGHALVRWLHLAAGVIWIGQLYFFNLVNAAFVARLDAETKLKVVPELLPRALFWFRWGAVWTWVSGLLLLALVYWDKPNFSTDGVNAPARFLAAFGIVIVGAFVYDVLARALAKQPVLAITFWFALALGFGWILRTSSFFQASQRAAFIHVGALLGTAMIANVWQHIWPAQRRNISAMRARRAPDPADVALAGLRSRHNMYMSLPILFLMLAVHAPEIGVTFGEPWMWMLGAFLIALSVTPLLYKLAARTPLE